VNPKPRNMLTREKILLSALNLADKDGLKGLSMRKIAAANHCEAMSLYNHINNKDDILDGLVDLIAAEIETPDIHGDWRQNMRRRAISAHQVLLKHPWATQLIVSRINTGPAMLRYINATIGCLHEAGFSYAMVDHAWNAIDSHIYGFTLQKLNFPIADDEFAATAESHLALIPVDRFPYLNGMASQVITGKHDGAVSFEFGLDLILAGLDQQLTNQK